MVRQKNKENTQELLELLFNSTISLREKKDRIGDYINVDQYIQHSPNLRDGHQQLIDLVEEFDQTFVDYSITVKRLIGEGDYVFAHCHYKFGKEDDQGKAIAEVFRFSSGKMVEHWDVIQDIQNTSPNKRSMF